MRTEKFKAVVECVASMTEAQLDQLVAAVEQRRVQTKALRILETARDPKTCLHCGSATVVKNGHSCGLQRYRCRACKKTYNATTGTPLAGLHRKERFFQQGACLAEGLTVRQAAAELGVATSTAFRLRHRFLTAVVAHQRLGAARGGRDLLPGVAEGRAGLAAKGSREGWKGRGDKVQEGLGAGADWPGQREPPGH